MLLFTGLNKYAMKPNFGIFDSIIRIAISMVLFGLGITYESWWGLFGFIPIIIYLFRWSLIYYIVGINTYEGE